MAKYCESIYQTNRRKTREVLVGHVGIGGSNSVRIQSMTTSNTRDVLTTQEQIMRLADAGCEIVRVTVQGIKEAEACEAIKSGLIQKGYRTPLVADIHFFPAAAMHVVDFVDKVRINPGNFADRRASFKMIEYDDISYAKEIDKIEEKFTPLVEKCKRLKKSIRIGANHGSLSDRIMNRYGDTPQGMVESALEYARICRKHNFHEFIFSMKSSNPQVMILAYRLLVAEMYKLDRDYPLHLGVTEAGLGEDGRIKSAMGIGALMLDGLGDTIRVSLTEDAWHEIDPCQRIIAFASKYVGQGVEPFNEIHRHFDSINRRQTILPKDISMHAQGSVFISVKQKDLTQLEFYQKIGCHLQLGMPKIKKTSADSLLLKDTFTNDCHKQTLQKLIDIGISVITSEVACKHTSSKDVLGKTLVPLANAKERQREQMMQSRFALVEAELQGQCLLISDERPDLWPNLIDLKPSVIFLAPEINRLHYCRLFFDWLQQRKLKVPVILNFSYSCTNEEVIIQAAAECGALLCDGFGEGLCIEGNFDVDLLRTLSFNILQAARMRTSKTDFISCPSCGRTLFDLQDVTQRIKKRTGHLSGVKIAIMGCIVNGPGEMADADFGYVGSKPGMIDLYVGKECVEKDIDFANADDCLVDLIKRHGRWVEVNEESQIELV